MPTLCIARFDRLAALLCAAAALTAQTFEVASVKRSTRDSGNDMTGGPGTLDPGRFRYTSATLEDLIVTAYHVGYSQVSSSTPIDKDSFDVEATVPPGATREQFRVMLQNLLADRFGLKLHREVRTFSGYALRIAKSGSKLGDRPKKVDAEFPELAPDKPGLSLVESPKSGYYVVRLRAQRMPVSELARSIHVPGDGPVVDETGLSGKYDFTLEYAYGGRATNDVPEAPPAPSVFTAVTEQLGLQLVSKRVPMDVLAVESFRRVPTEN